MIHFICALKSEAAPLLEFFQLKSLPGNRPFNIYLNKDKSISLTVSGIGKTSSAAATSYTFAALPCRQNEIWVNIGMAGHRSHNIGEIFICNKITDAGSDRKWYPHPVFESEIARNSLLTLDRPSTDYDDNLFDMEASGFLSSATRFSYLEFIQTVKIVSDNADEPARKLKADAISSLISPHLASIASIVFDLRSTADNLKSKLNTSKYVEAFQEQCHFSDYQNKKLGQVLLRWCLLLSDQSPLEACEGKLQSANEVIATLNQLLDSSDFSLSRDIQDV